MINSSMVNPRSLRNLDRIIIATGCSLAVIALVFSVGAGLKYFEKNKSIKLVAAKNKEATALQNTIRSASLVKHSANKANVSSQIQAILDASCRRHSVSLLDFQAASENVGFLTRFKKNGNDKGWLQSNASALVRGPVTEVYEVVKELTTTSIPVELETLELQGVADEKTGASHVSVKISFRILKQEVAK